MADIYFKDRTGPTFMERVVSFDAYIAEVLPTTDGQNIYLGVQFVGLEANPESFRGLHRLCNYDEIDWTGNLHVLRLT